MELYLIRHTKVNLPTGTCYGQSDVGLADTFQQEADIIKQQISNLRFDQIYSSPLLRCKKLSEYLFNSEIKYDDRLMELNFGDWELQKWTNLKNPAVDAWMNDFVNKSCPNGESFLIMFQRVKSFINEILTQNLNRVVLITHSGVIRCILTYLKNEDLKDAFKLEIPFGEVIKVKL